MPSRWSPEPSVHPEANYNCTRSQILREKLFCDMENTGSTIILQTCMQLRTLCFLPSILPSIGAARLPSCGTQEGDAYTNEVENESESCLVADGTCNRKTEHRENTPQATEVCFGRNTLIVLCGYSPDRLTPGIARFRVIVWMTDRRTLTVERTSSYKNAERTDDAVQTSVPSGFWYATLAFLRDIDK